VCEHGVTIFIKISIYVSVLMMFMHLKCDHINLQFFEKYILKHVFEDIILWYASLVLI
jgi:hypothetical protein